MMISTRRFLSSARGKAALCALLLGSPLGGCAQTPEPIGPEGIIGERARVQFDAGNSREGILRDLQGDTLTLEIERGPLFPIPLSPTARLEIVRGTKSNAGKGAGLGALIGTVGFAIVGAATCGDSWFTPEECALAGGVAGAGLGALVGLIVGSASRTERWVEVDRTR